MAEKVKKRQEYFKNYRERNKDKLNEYQRKWRSCNPEKVKGYHERYWMKVLSIADKKPEIIML